MAYDDAANFSARLVRVPRGARRDGLLHARHRSESFGSAGGWCGGRYRRLWGPLLLYPLLILVFAVLSLIGWRVMRRFGWRGELVFLAVVAVQGTLRDYFEAGQALGVIELAPGLATVLVDIVCWVGLTALAQAVMRLVAGPAMADPLARQIA